MYFANPDMPTDDLCLFEIVIKRRFGREPAQHRLACVWTVGLSCCAETSRTLARSSVHAPRLRSVRTSTICASFVSK
jgi:hypothetical protein